MRFAIALSLRYFDAACYAAPQPLMLISDIDICALASIHTPFRRQPRRRHDTLDAMMLMPLLIRRRHAPFCRYYYILRRC